MSTPEFTVSVLSGDGAHRWMRDPKNQERWQKLYADCQWRTVFLSPGFSEVWFANYGADWNPVFAIANDADGRLAGLMPLAAHGTLITGVGAHQAEYSGFLSGHGNADRFFEVAVKSICRDFPRHEVRFRYLPPGTPPGAMRRVCDVERRALLETSERHVFVLDEASINEIQKKKGNRSKLNRLKRMGSLEMRKLNPEEFETQIQDIVALCDFRQGAINNSCPFLDDPRKKNFHLDWIKNFAAGIHVSGMFLDGKIVSCIIFALSDREAHVAILAHSPELAENSPSKIHFYQAASMLASEGILRIDMTPGGDDWKARFGSTMDQVSELTICANLHGALASRVFAAAKPALRAAKANALALLRRLTRSRHSGDRPPVKEPVRVRYAVRLPQLGAPLSEKEVGRNALSDLLKYGPALTKRDRQTFLAHALMRIEAGERCYSIRNGDAGLACIGWASASTSPSAGADDATLILSDFVVTDAPTSERALDAVVAHALRDNCRKEGISVEAAQSEIPLRQSLERLGFADIRRGADARSVTQP